MVEVEQSESAAMDAEEGATEMDRGAVLQTFNCHDFAPTSTLAASNDSGAQRGGGHTTRGVRQEVDLVEPLRLSSQIHIRLDLSRQSLELQQKEIRSV